MADDPELLVSRDPILRKTRPVRRTPPSGQSDFDNKVADLAMGVDPTPSQLAARKFGSIDDDIDLPVAKPPARKPITAPRTLTGGRR